MCSSCAKKAAARNSRVVARSLKASKKIKAKLKEQNNENTKPKDEGQ